MNKIELHVAIDVDGVLRNFIGSLKREFEAKNPNKKIKGFEEHDNYGLANLIYQDSEVSENELVNFAFGNPNTSYQVFVEADPFEEISKINEYVKSLRKEVYFHLSICTSQKNHWQQEATREWLNIHNINFDSLIFTRSGKDIFNFDYLLDDKESNVLRRSGGILRNRPWNQKTGVDSLKEFFKIIKQKEL